MGITSGPDGNIWFTEHDTNKIGKLVLPSKPTLANQTVAATTGKATTVNLVSGVANDPSAATLAIVSAPSHGTATVDTTAGTITYTSAAGYLGADSLIYTLCSADDTGICAQATLSFNVVVSAPNTGFGVHTTTPLLTMGEFGMGAGVLLALAYASRKHARR
jgi:hypothetical protein